MKEAMINSIPVVVGMPLFFEELFDLFKIIFRG